MRATLFPLPDAARGLGIRLCATRGAGKSRFLGRVLAWQDFLRQTPVCVIDPIGGVIDNLLDKLTRQPKAVQEGLWQRIRYVDMGGEFGHVIPLPLYYRTGKESLFTISQRPLEVIRKLTPALQNASILGWPAVAKIGRYTGMILAAHGCQITEATSLLNTPKQWEPRIQDALRRYPELAEPAGYFLSEYPKLPRREQDNQTLSYRNQFSMFNLDDTLKAQYGAERPGITWEEVIANKLCILFDYRHVLDADRKRFGVVWAFQFLMEFIKQRGPGRHTPLSLIFDEITYALSGSNAHNDLLADDLEELVARLARNHAIWCTFAHQELNQLNRQAGKVLWTCGTQVFGATSEMAAAEEVANRFYRYNPHLVKKAEYRPLLQRGEDIGGTTTTTEYTRQEQTYLNAVKQLDLPRFTFLVGAARQEGEVPTSLTRVSFARVDRGAYVHEELVRKARARLMVKHGKSIGSVLADIRARQERLFPGEKQGAGFGAEDIPPQAKKERGEPL